MSLMSRLHEAKVKMLNDQEDPWKRVLERALPADVVCMSVVGLLDLLNFAPTTGNARRLARIFTHLTAYFTLAFWLSQSLPRER